MPEVCNGILAPEPMLVFTIQKVAVVLLLVLMVYLGCIINLAGHLSIYHSTGNHHLSLEMQEALLVAGEGWVFDILF